MDAQKQARRRGGGRQGPTLPRTPKRGVNLRHDFGLRLVKVANVLLIALPFILCWVLYYIHTVVKIGRAHV